ncbi:palmitoyl protein thioesterase, partial [Oesophagostomum dentatum]
MLVAILVFVILATCSAHYSVDRRNRLPHKPTTLKAVPVVMWHGMVLVSKNTTLPQLSDVLSTLLHFLCSKSSPEHVPFSSVVQAQYWHDPLHEEEYKRKSIFLADINNERDINPDYKRNLLNLKNMLLIKFNGDNMVVPKESSWFGFYKEGDLDTILPMNETELYQETADSIIKLEFGLTEDDDDVENKSSQNEEQSRIQRRRRLHPLDTHKTMKDNFATLPPSLFPDTHRAVFTKTYG